mgnify:CR=1 FL=1
MSLLDKPVLDGTLYVSLSLLFILPSPPIVVSSCEIHSSASKEKISRREWKRMLGERSRQIRENNSAGAVKTKAERRILHSTYN